MSITKNQASILYGYGYKLREVKTGIIWNKMGILPTSIVCNTDKENTSHLVPFNKIGTDYLIMARPMSELTKEIEGVGVPIVELAKQEYREAYSGSNEEFNEFEMSEFEMSIKSLCSSIETITLTMAQWLYTNNFAVDIPEELITPI